MAHCLTEIEQDAYYFKEHFRRKHQSSHTFKTTSSCLHSSTQSLRKKSPPWLASNAHRRIIFSDESPFSIEEVFNKQNTRILAPTIQAANQAGRVTARAAFPMRTVVWGGISANGKTPLLFIDSKVKINQAVYQQQVLQPFRDHWAPALFPDGNWIFQQDSAPAHRGRASQMFCERHFPDFLHHTEWPSNSPDLNPLDYSIWGILKDKACTTRHRSLEALKASLQRAWNDIDIDVLRATVDSFPKRLRACVRARGGRFESV